MTRLLLAAVFLSAAPIDLCAQVTGRPPRSAERQGRTRSGLFGGQRVADPARMQQQLSFTLDMLTGYEDNLSPDGNPVGDNPAAPRYSAATGTASAILDYRRTNTDSGIESSARTVAAAYHGVSIQPSLGASGSVRAFTRWFNRLGVSGWTEADYRPTFSLDTLSTGAPADAVAPQDPTAGVTEIRSVHMGAGGSTSLEWTSRHNTSLSYAHTRARSTIFGDIPQVGHSATVSHRWAFARNIAVDGSYGESRQTSDASVEFGRRSELETQVALIGFEVRVPVSLSRRLTFAVDAGATRVDTSAASDDAPIHYVTPSGSASVRLDLGRTWAASAQFNRVVSTLEGLRHSFVTTTANYWLGGNIGRRSAVTVSGSAGSGAPHEGDLGSYRTLGGTAQVQYRVSQCCAVVTSYSYYEHRLRDLTAVPIGFPRTIDRSAVRVGMSFWLPLHGTFPVDGRR